MSGVKIKKRVSDEEQNIAEQLVAFVNQLDQFSRTKKITVESQLNVTEEDDVVAVQSIEQIESANSQTNARFVEDQNVDDPLESLSLQDKTDAWTLARFIVERYRHANQDIKSLLRTSYQALKDRKFYSMRQDRLTSLLSSK
ncbi:unnamed protein product [Agarophyton chilense]